MSWTAARASVAGLSRSRPPDDPDLVAARLELRTERAAEYIRGLVDQAPPLTDAQRAKLAALLAPAHGAAGPDDIGEAA
jgi:hypothetical protein